MKWILVLLAVSQWAFSDSVRLSSGETFYSLKDKQADKNVLFIHGGKFSSWTWLRTSPFIAGKGFNTLKFDFYGMGKSDSLRVNMYTRSRLIGQTRELLEHVGWLNSDKPLYIVGTGLGASVAMRIANEFPVVKKVVLLSPAYNVEGTKGEWGALLFDYLRSRPANEWTYRILRRKITKEVGRFLAKLPESDRKIVKKLMYKEINQSGYTRNMYRRLMGDLFRSYSKGYKKLAASGTPTLLIAGSRDSDIPRSHRARIGKGNPQFEELIFEDMGSEFSVIKSKEVRTRMLEFLQQ